MGGAGNGRESTDRSNFVQLVSNDIGANYVAYAKNITQTGKVVDNDAALKEVQHWALLGQNVVTSPNGGSDESKTDVAKIALIAGGSVAGVVVVGGGAAYVATHRDTFSFGGSGGAKAPAGYA